MSLSLPERRVYPWGFVSSPRQRGTGRGHNLKLRQGWFRLSIRNNFFTGREIRYCSGVRTEVVESSSFAVYEAWTWQSVPWSRWRGGFCHGSHSISGVSPNRNDSGNSRRAGLSSCSVGVKLVIVCRRQRRFMLLPFTILLCSLNTVLVSPAFSTLWLII